MKDDLNATNFHPSLFGYQSSREFCDWLWDAATDQIGAELITSDSCYRIVAGWLQDLSGDVKTLTSRASAGSRS